MNESISGLQGIIFYENSHDELSIVITLFIHHASILLGRFEPFTDM